MFLPFVSGKFLFKPIFHQFAPPKKILCPPKIPPSAKDQPLPTFRLLGQQAKKEAERKKAEAEGRQIEEEEEETKERHVEAELLMDVFWSSGEPMDGLNSGLIIFEQKPDGNL